MGVLEWAGKKHQAGAISAGLGAAKFCLFLLPPLPALLEQRQPPLSSSIPAPLLYLLAEEPGAWPAD